MAECKISKCTCQNEFQDKTYGKGMRLFNPIGKNQPGRDYRCTICGKTISEGYTQKKK